VEWNAIGAVNVFDKLRSSFEVSSATQLRRWRGRLAQWIFRLRLSADRTSTTDGAELGTERNGAFY
jgi:hypothetical protein